ncbi:MAG: threonine synthase [Candidatus Altimarinota bacterium]
MPYHSTRNPDHRVDLETAIIQGLARDGGLYVPEKIPQISLEEWSSWKELSYNDLCWRLSEKWFGDEIPSAELRRMIDEAYFFEPRIKHLKGALFALELFHGPTLSFKDFGARMLAQLMNHFAKKSGKKLTILAATSGDTGVAVASAFADLEYIQVVILYPQGKVSPFQESQMLSLQGNVRVFAVDGTFDDCQANVKKAFLDPDLKSTHLTSANSINIGRLIPQCWYYLSACRQLPTANSQLPTVFSIPSGNFGNLAACLLAKMMGAPIGKIIAATNINDIVPHYLTTGEFTPRPSLLTLANSMDIGNPSNWERITSWLGNDLQKIREHLIGSKKTDEDIRSSIAKAWKEYHYALDPHGAVSISAVEDSLNQQPTTSIAVMTGSPYKYRELIEEITGSSFSDWPRLEASDTQPDPLSNEYTALKAILSSMS